MEFTFTEEQTEVAALARRILEQVDEPRLRALETSGDHLDVKAWTDLAEAGLVGLTVPEAAGGLGFGAFESVVVLEAVGESLAAVPLLEAHVAGLLLGRHSAPAGLLEGVASGVSIVALAVDEHGAGPRRPATTATPTPTGWSLSGTKAATRWAADAAVLIVTAQGLDRRYVFCVDPRSPGVSLEKVVATTGQPAHVVVLDGVTVDAAAEIGDSDAVVDEVVDAMLIAQSAVQLGIASRALSLTTTYVSQRQQFGRPIGSFQGVAIRVADAYIDVECMRSTVWQAADRIGRGLPSEGAAEVAKFWASDGGNRVLAAATHLHGGIGVTTDYPLYRYYLAARELELALGGASVRIDAIGDALADWLTPETVR